MERLGDARLDPDARSDEDGPGQNSDLLPQ